MSGKKVSDLPVYVSAQAADVLYAVTDGSSKSVTGGSFVKTIPVSADGSTTPRSLKERLADIPNVKDFGAKGDYDPTTQAGTNDQTAFDAAVSAASDNSIYLPEGNYLITTHPGTGVETLGPGHIYLDGTKDINGKVLRIGVSEGVQNNRVGGVLLGGEGPGPDGVIMKSGGNSGWTRIQPTRDGSQIQWQLYTAGFAGTGDAVAGTGFIDIVTGSAERSDIEVGDLIGFNEIEYRLKTITSSAGNVRWEVEYPDATAESFAASVRSTWQHCYQYNEGVCNASGTTISWVSGDYFDGLGDAPESKIKVDGNSFGISSRPDDRTIILTTAAATASGVAFIKKDITPERKVTVYNLQTLRGTNEENFNLYGDILGRWYLRPGSAGDGEARRLIFRAANNVDDGEQNHFTLLPNGRMLLGLTEPTIAGATSAKMEVARLVDIGASAAGTDFTRIVRIRATFAETGGRNLDIGIYNDQSGGSIGSSGNQRIYIQPGGGSTLFGAQDTATFLVEIAGTLGPHADNTHDDGSSSLRWANVYATQFRAGDGTPIWTSGSGSPEGSVTAGVGSLYTDVTGSAATTLYVKESGVSNTGWVAK